MIMKFNIFSKIVYFFLCFSSSSELDDSEKEGEEDPLDIDDELWLEESDSEEFELSK